MAKLGAESRQKSRHFGANIQLLGTRQPNRATINPLSVTPLRRGYEHDAQTKSPSTARGIGEERTVGEGLRPGPSQQA